MTAKCNNFLAVRMHVMMISITVNSKSKYMYIRFVSVCSLNCTEEVTNYAGMCSLVRCFLISR